MFKSTMFEAGRFFDFLLPVAQLGGGSTPSSNQNKRSGEGESAQSKKQRTSPVDGSGTVTKEVKGAAEGGDDEEEEEERAENLGTPGAKKRALAKTRTVSSLQGSAMVDGTESGKELSLIELRDYGFFWMILETH
jgi:hypothetical protein